MRGGNDICIEKLEKSYHIPARLSAKLGVQNDVEREHLRNLQAQGVGEFLAWSIAEIEAKL